MPAATSRDLLCITGIGMVTALGYDLDNACAASRAGLSRATALDYFKIRSAEDGEVGPVVGHAAPVVAVGFEGSARLLALAKAALDDFAKSVDLSALDPRRTSLFLALPHPNRVFQGLPLVASEEVRKNRAEQAEGALDRAECEATAGRLLKRIVSIAQLPVSLDHSQHVWAGHCGASTAIARAFESFAHGHIDHAIVGGVDSLLEESVLQWLLDTNRLKTDGIPVGLQPGEAACFVLLERGPKAGRGRHALGTITRPLFSMESRPVFSATPSTGRAMAQVLRGVVQSNGLQTGQPLWVISDQTGEHYRGSEWGSALVQLDVPAESREAISLWYPAMNFGDTASASGCLAISVVACAYKRRYPIAEQAIVMSASDDGQRSAFVLAAA